MSPSHHRARRAPPSPALPSSLQPPLPAPAPTFRRSVLASRCGLWTRRYGAMGHYPSADHPAGSERLVFNEDTGAYVSNRCFGWSWMVPMATPYPVPHTSHPILSESLALTRLHGNPAPSKNTSQHTAAAEPHAIPRPVARSSVMCQCGPIHPTTHPSWFVHPIPPASPLHCPPAPAAGIPARSRRPRTRTTPSRTGYILRQFLLF